MGAQGRPNSRHSDGRRRNAPVICPVRVFRVFENAPFRKELANPLLSSTVAKTMTTTTNSDDRGPKVQSPIDICRCRSQIAERPGGGSPNACACDGRFSDCSRPLSLCCPFRNIELNHALPAGKREVFDLSTVAWNHDVAALPASAVGMTSRGGNGGLDMTQDGKKGGRIQRRETV